MPKYDFMSFGEADIRLTPPGHDRLGQTDTLQLGISAAELNCCVNISNLSMERLSPTLKTAYITKLVDAWSGRYIMQNARAYGVDMSHVLVEPYDRIGRTRNGINFMEMGIGPRPSMQTYDRGHTALSKIQPGEINWKTELDTRWFHTTGIVTALGQHTATEVLAALQAAKANGATTSYDINYRSTLWSREAARNAICPVIPYVDVFFGGREDLALLLDLPADTWQPQREEAGELAAYHQAAQAFFQAYPGLKAVATSLRTVKSATYNDWQTVLVTRKGLFASRQYLDLEIYDRVGGGDSFASALIYGMLCDMPEQETIDFAGAYSALSHTIRNDWCLVTREEAQELMGGGTAAIRR